MQQTSIAQILTLQNIATWSKKDLSELAQASVGEVAENGEDVLGLLALAAKLEHYAGEVKTYAKQAGINDLAKYDRAGVAKGGVKLQLAETGVTYDYSRDLIWQRLNKAVEAAKAEQAGHERIMKAIPDNGMFLEDEETGEIYRAYPPVKSAKESIKATIL